MSRPTIKDRNNSTGLIGLGSMPSQAPVASFNIAGIENLLETKGFLAYHYKSVPNPDREKLNSPVMPDTQATFQGRLYFDVRPIRIVPTNIKLEERLQAAGIYGYGSAVMNVSGQYYDERQPDQVQIGHNDIIVLNPTITSPAEQLFEYNPTGPQTLNYKIQGVDVLLDSEREYEEGYDYSLVDGEIFWLEGGQKPKMVGGKPAVLSIRYYVTPMFVVVDLPHNLRIIPSNEYGHGALPRDAVYAPQLVVAKALTSMQVNNILDWKALPPLPEHRASKNTTGGSF